MIAHRLRPVGGEAGSATIEFTAMVPYLLIAAAFAWQVLLLSSVVAAAQDAARTGSRAQALGRDGETAAVEALSPWMQEHARAVVGAPGDCDEARDRTGTRVTVCIAVPVLWPGLSFPELDVIRDAEFPPSASNTAPGAGSVAWG